MFTEICVHIGNSNSACSIIEHSAYRSVIDLWADRIPLLLHTESEGLPWENSFTKSGHSVTGFHAGRCRASPVCDDHILPWSTHRHGGDKTWYKTKAGIMIQHKNNRDTCKQLNVYWMLHQWCVVIQKLTRTGSSTVIIVSCHSTKHRVMWHDASHELYKYM